MIGVTQCTFSIGKHSYTYHFVVCKNLSRPFILGIDFLRQHLIDTCWSPNGKFRLRKHKTTYRIFRDFFIWIFNTHQESYWNTREACYCS